MFFELRQYKIKAEGYLRLDPQVRERRTAEVVFQAGGGKRVLAKRDRPLH